MVVGVLQALMGATVAMLGCRFAYRMTRSGMVALVSGVLIAFHLPLVFYGGLLLTEVATSFATMLGLWLALRSSDRASWPLAVAAGLALGWASVIRPSLVLLVPLAALACGWGCRRRRRPGALLPR